MTSDAASSGPLEGRIRGWPIGAGWIAAAGWVAFVGLAIVALGVAGANHRLTPGDVTLAAAFLVFATVGAVLASRLPWNSVGWTLLVVAVAAIVQRMVGEYVASAASGASLPFIGLVAWVDAWIWGLSVGCAVVVLPMVFPDGRAPAGNLRRFAWLMVALFAIAPALSAIAPGPLPGLPSVDNPFGIGPLAPVADIGRSLLPFLGIIPIVGCAVVPLVRFRRAAPDERHQLKWFTLAAALLAVVLLANALIGDALAVPLAICVGLVPAAIGIAVLRYRLYDVDFLINRTLVWVPLTALLGGLYASLVALIQRIFVNVTGDRSDAAIIITTLVLAGLFTPARRILDTIVDTRFRVNPPALPRSSAAALALDDAALERRVEEIARRVATEVVRSDRGTIP